MNASDIAAVTGLITAVTALVAAIYGIINSRHIRTVSNKTDTIINGFDVTPKVKDDSGTST